MVALLPMHTHMHTYIYAQDYIAKMDSKQKKQLDALFTSAFGAMQKTRTSGRVPHAPCETPCECWRTGRAAAHRTCVSVCVRVRPVRARLWCFSGDPCIRRDKLDKLDEEKGSGDESSQNPSLHTLTHHTQSHTHTHTHTHTGGAVPAVEEEESSDEGSESEEEVPPAKPTPAKATPKDSKKVCTQ